jgi:RimJ/RimL family protein N-acetyltransferase
MNLTFRIMGEQELAELRAWFNDPELNRRISYPTDEWFAYVTDTPNVFAWTVFDADTAVGMSQVDLADDSRAYFDFAVKPDLRGHGYGRYILSQLVDQPELSAVTMLLGYVEPDNLASRRCLSSAGYHNPNETPDADGLIEFIYTRR